MKITTRRWGDQSVTDFCPGRSGEGSSNNPASAPVTPRLATSRDSISPRRDSGPGNLIPSREEHELVRIVGGQGEILGMSADDPQCFDQHPAEAVTRPQCHDVSGRQHARHAESREGIQGVDSAGP